MVFASFATDRGYQWQRKLVGPTKMRFRDGNRLLAPRGGVSVPRPRWTATRLAMHMRVILAQTPPLYGPVSRKGSPMIIAVGEGES
jgi:hypothetical protein